MKRICGPTIFWWFHATNPCSLISRRTIIHVEIKYEIKILLIFLETGWVGYKNLQHNLNLLRIPLFNGQKRKRSMRSTLFGFYYHTCRRCYEVHCSNVCFIPCLDTECTYSVCRRVTATKGRLSGNYILIFLLFLNTEKVSNVNERRENDVEFTWTKLCRRYFTDGNDEMNSTSVALTDHVMKNVLYSYQLWQVFAVCSVLWSYSHVSKERNWTVKALK